MNRGIRDLWRRLRGNDQSRKRVALAVAIGLFIGCLPVYGLHLVLCLAVCVPRRFDSVLAYLPQRRHASELEQAQAELPAARAGVEHPTEARF